MKMGGMVDFFMLSMLMPAICIIQPPRGIVNSCGIVLIQFSMKNQPVLLGCDIIMAGNFTQKDPFPEGDEGPGWTLPSYFPERVYTQSQRILSRTVNIEYERGLKVYETDLKSLKSLLLPS